MCSVQSRSVSLRGAASRTRATKQSRRTLRDRFTLATVRDDRALT
jgi:hypothetical protein